MIVRRHNGECCLLYEDCYRNNIEHILHLFEIARWDFPNLRYGDVCVIRLNSRTNKGMMAIHWHGECLRTYDVVKRFDI